MQAVRTELERAESERWGWMMELSTHVQHTMEDLRELDQLIRKLNGARPVQGECPGDPAKAPDSPGNTVKAAVQAPIPCGDPR
jgi:hypothetical protein